MRRLLLISCVLGCARGAAFAQMLSVKASRELLARLQQSKPDTHRVQLWQALSTYYMFKPHAQTADMDSALNMARQAEKLSVTLHDPKGQANSYLLYSKVYNHKGNRQQARALISKAITIFIHYHNLDELGEAYFALAGYYSLTGPEMAERIYWGEQGLSAFKQSGNKLKQANGNKELGDLYQLDGDNFKALATLQQSLSLYKSVGSGSDKLRGIYDLLGQVSCEVGDYRDAVRYGLLAVQAAEQVNDTSLQMATIYNRLGITYQALNELDLANVYFNKSIAIAQKENDPVTIYELASNITNTLVKLNRPLDALTFLQAVVKKFPVPDIGSQVDVNGDLVQIYLLLKQYALAQHYGDQLIRLSENTEHINKERQLFAKSMLIKLFLATRQYQKAQTYLLIHKAISEQRGSLRSLATNHLWWFKLDSTQGNYPSAIGHYQRYKALTDSLFTESKSKQIALLQTQFDTKKKDQDIRLQAQHIEILKNRLNCNSMT